MDTRVQKGADVNSDYYWMQTRIRLRLGTNRNQEKVNPRLDVERLKDVETRKKYTVAVRNKLTKLKDHNGDSEDINTTWEQQRLGYVGAAEKVLGYRKGKSKPWISKATWQLIDEREIKIKIHSVKSNRFKDWLK